MNNFDSFLATADVEPYAQSIIDDVVPGGYAIQGMAIGTWEGVSYMLCGQIDGTTLTGTCLTLYNMETGEIAAQKIGLELNHINGATFCTQDNCFYIAPDGGRVGRLNKVYAFDGQLNLVRTIQIDGYNAAYGIGWSEKNSHFYITVANRLIVECDYNFNVLNTFPNPDLSAADYVEQSLATDGDWIYLINNGLTNTYPGRYYNKVDVYTMDMKYHTSVMVPVARELEAIAFLNGQCYFAFATQTSGLIFRGTIKNSNKLYQSRYSQSMNFDIQLGGRSITIWCDSSATQFFCDGTRDKPFNRLYNCNTIMYSCFTDITVNIIGDYSDKNINVKGSAANQRFFFNGYADKNTRGQCAIGGIYFINMNSVFCQDIKITKRNDPSPDLLTLYYCGYIYLTNIEFAGRGTEYYAIRSIGSNLVLAGCAFNSSVTSYLIRAREGGGILFTDNNTTFAAGITHNGFSVEVQYGTVKNQPLALLYEANAQNFPILRVTAYDLTQTIDVLKIIQNGVYQFSASINLQNRPTGTSGGCTVEITNLGTSLYLINYTDWQYREYHMIVRRGCGNSSWMAGRG